MKRTEAIARMAGFLSGYVWYREKHPEELLELAGHVILGAEKIGMLPPYSFEVGDRNWKKDRELSSGGNEWDSE